jgi:hypothetical protein
MYPMNELDNLLDDLLNDTSEYEDDSLVESLGRVDVLRQLVPEGASRWDPDSME